jgi:hypothetical protein
MSGIYSLGDENPITVAVTNSVITDGVSSSGVAQSFIDGLDFAAAVTLQANFTYGSGGTTLKVDVETSIDQGFSWVPIARFAFTTASAEKIFNLSGLTPVTTVYTPATLSDDSVKDGILGDRLRARITSTGTYAGNTSVSVRVAVR